MEPKLASLFGKTGNWKEIIEAELSLEASTPEQIRVIWEENVRRAKESNEELPPEHFAQMFVDENFQA